MFADPSIAVFHSLCRNYLTELVFCHLVLQMNKYPNWEVSIGLLWSLVFASKLIDSKVTVQVLQVQLDK